MTRNETEVPASVGFGLGEAKIRFTYEGQDYALRMDKEVFDSLVHPERTFIPKIGVVKE